MEDNKDWSSIRSSIEGVLQDILEGNDIGVQAKELSDKAGDVIRNAGSYVKKNYESIIKNAIDPTILMNRKREKPKVFLNAKRTESIVRMFVGIPMSVIFTITLTTVTAVLPPSKYIVIWLIAAMPLISLNTLGIGLSVPAMMRLNLLKKATLYYRIMNGKPYINIKDLAQMSNENQNTVINNLIKMIEAGIFPEGHMDEQRKCFMLDDNIYREYLALEDQRREQEKITAEVREKLQDNKDLTAVLEMGRSYIFSIKELHLGIGTEPMSSKLTTLEKLLNAIFDRVQQEPKELSHMDKLMRYYLPTTIKLIKTYSDFDNIISPDSEVKNTKKEIELTLDSINKAFAEFQNRLFKSMAFDAGTDAALLKVMLAKDGLVGTMDEFREKV